MLRGAKRQRTGAVGAMVPAGVSGVTRRAAVRRKIQRARASIGRSRVSMSRNVHCFRRMAQSYTQDITGAGLSGALSFALSDTLGASEFDVLYDRFMLTCVVVKFRIVNNPDAAFALNTNISTATWGNATNWFPRLFYCKDYDDASSETLAQLRERAKTKMVVLKPNRYHKVVIRPAALVQTYYTAVGAGYAPKWKQWIDMAQNSLPHYGLKYNVDCSGITPKADYPFKLEIERQYFFKCKDVR